CAILRAREFVSARYPTDACGGLRGNVGWVEPQGRSRPSSNRAFTPVFQQGVYARLPTGRLRPSSNRAFTPVFQQGVYARRPTGRLRPSSTGYGAMGLWRNSSSALSERERPMMGFTSFNPSYRLVRRSSTCPP